MKKTYHYGLKKDLQGRHVSMIALGGTIAAGLFLTSGAAIAEAGPGGTLLAYFMVSCLVFVIMTSLTEMSIHLSLEGAFRAYPSRFVDPALGFANGWSWWIGGSMTLAAEIVGSVIIIKFWFPSSSTVLWAAFLLTAMLVINLFSVRNFGETSYWLASIKVITVVLFIILGILMILGVVDGFSSGFSNWTFDAGSQGKAPFPKGMAGVFMVFVVAGFSFSNVELIGVSAAESANPAKDLPKSMYTIFFVLVILYLGTLFIIGTMLPFTNKYLLSTDISTIAQSPFTVIFESAGFTMASSLMNIVILSALLTAGSATLYSVSRLLCHMADEKEAPAFFSKINSKGVPVRAVMVTGLSGGVAFLTSFIGDGAVYTFCYSIVGISTFINWFCLLLAHYRFRKSLLAQGYSLDTLTFSSPAYPYINIAGLGFCLLLILASNYWMFLEDFTWYNFISCYGIVPVVILLFIGYKFSHKTKFVKLEDCNLSPD